MFKLAWELWRNGRTLVETVTKLAHEVEQLRMEWSDVLDMLRAREERLRKRDKAAVRQDLAPDPEHVTMKLLGARRQTP